MRCVYLIVVTLFVAVHVQVRCVQLAALRKCTRLGRFAKNYNATSTVYLPSIIQCAAYCEYYGSSWRYFYYENNECRLYASYPGFSGFCRTDNKTMHRYCVGQKYTSLNGGLDYCQSIGMALVSLETLEENQFVFDFLRSTITAGTCLWTSGYSQTGASNDWIWKDTGMRIATFAWSSIPTTLPAESGIRTCVGSVAADIFWSAATATSMFNVLCEQDVTQNILGIL